MVDVSLLHPGQMGAALGAELVSCGHRVSWCADGRSAATKRRATDAGLEARHSLRATLEGADVAISVCPPSAAVEVAEQVAQSGYRGTYVDANAIAPATAEQIAALLPPGAEFVDGGIVGPPPTGPGLTRVALSGSAAAPVARLFEGSLVETIVLGSGAGEASAFKMAFAAWTKGSGALLLAIRAFADAHGVDDALVTEWERRAMPLDVRSRTAATDMGPKAWRFEGEMREIARSLGDVDLPDGFFLAAAELWGRLDQFKNHPGPTLEELVDGLGARRVR